MIYRLLVYDKKSDKSAILFDRDILDLNYSLLLQLIKAMTQLSSELKAEQEKSIHDLKEVEIGTLQIAMLAQNHLTYIAIQDSFDNEPFSRRLIQLIIDNFHDTILNIPFADEIKQLEDLEDDISELLNTMHFPQNKLKKTNDLINEFLFATNNIVDTLFLTDLDDGIVKIWVENKETQIKNILLEILSEIHFEKAWIGEMPIYENNGTKLSYQEVWFIHRIGLTDFCLVGRASYNTTISREYFLSKLEELTYRIHELLLPT